MSRYPLEFGEPQKNEKGVFAGFVGSAFDSFRGLLQTI